MALNRSFSFDEHDDTHLPSQTHAIPRPAVQGYQVSNPAAFLPRDRSPSPISSVGSISPPPDFGRQSDPRYQQTSYISPQQDPATRRISAYRRSRQEDTAYHGSSSTGNREMEMSNIPPPPPHARSSISPTRPMYQMSPYHDRSPSRDRPYTPSGSGNTPSPERDNPFATPNRSHVNIAPPAATLVYGYRPGPERLDTGYSGTSTDFRNARMDYAGLGDIDPVDIEDDDDDPFSSIPGKQGKRGSRTALAGGAAADGGVAAAAAVGGGLLQGFAKRDTSGHYGSVPGGSGPVKKSSDWLSEQKHSNKKWKWSVAGLIILVIVLAIVGGVVGVLASKKTSSTSASSNANLTLTSPEIQALLNNPDLHKVFPGIDYTPQNAQYPDCLTTPPSQAYITQDVAVLSQLTPVIRLYGTDCNQTEMILEALNDLQMNDTIKLYAGVWLDTNTTTNNRQLDQFYNIINTYGTDPFLGVIVGNEVLFRKDMTESELIAQIDGVRTNLTSMGKTGLKVATSDLGSSWTETLAEAVDVVMSNIHPFFGGVAAPQAAAWTWEYWQNNDVPVSQGMSGKQQVISETGWPSAGGNDCTNGAGTSVNCTSSTEGAVAGIDEMNTFMSGWICDALTNGTDYFWFEAFDEPWKVIYNTPTEQWENNWGLMYVNRTLKPGISIPDCGGATATLPSS